MTVPKIKKKRTFVSRGARDGAVVRALASHQCGPSANPGFDSICGLSLLLVLSFAPRGFSPGTPVFPSPQRPTLSNSNSTRNHVDEEPLCGCATSKSLFIYLKSTRSSQVKRFQLNNYETHSLIRSHGWRATATGHDPMLSRTSIL